MNTSKRRNGQEIKELLMFLALREEGPIGRYHLKEIIGLSEHEGLVKQMLANLQKQGYVSASRSGCSLTEKGASYLDRRLRELHIAAIEPLFLPLLACGPVNAGIHLDDVADKIDSAMRIRDVAVRAGANGATIMLFKDGNLDLPSVNPDFFLENPILLKEIRECFNLKDNDVVAIVSADDKWHGLEASITIAYTLR